MMLNESRKVVPLFVIVLVLLSLFWLAVGPVVVPQISHANERHGREADVARQCMDGRNSHLFFNPTTNRSATVCDLDGMFGIVIADAAGNEVTAFLKNKMKRFDQVLQYMKNQGYTLLH